MEIPIFFKGIIIGVSVAAPVGPIGLLCIKRSLTHGKYDGLATGLGAAIADAIYSLIAGFGITAVSAFLIDHKFFVQIIAGIFLILVGLAIMGSSQHTSNQVRQGKSFFSTTVKTLILTLTNPVTVLAFAGIFAAFGINITEKGYISAIIMSCGVFIGSSIWFFSLSMLVSLFSNRCNPTTIKIINIISGSLLIAFGIFSFLSLTKH